jgi:hypothetical protein
MSSTSMQLLLSSSMGRGEDRLEDTMRTRYMDIMSALARSPCDAFAPALSRDALAVC